MISYWAKWRWSLTAYLSTCNLTSHVLKQYERDCANDAKYVEAEMAKHKVEELKETAKKVEKKKALNAHLKEKVDVEEAYLKEFNDFQEKWERKFQKFEEKVEASRTEMLESQKKQLQDAFELLEKKYSTTSKEVNNRVLNLQKIERALAQQKRYIEAQRTRDEWHKEQENIAVQQKLQVEKRKHEIANEYEKRNKKEVDDFITKINDMKMDLENERKNELERLMAKYDKIKRQLSQLQDSESKRIEHAEKFQAQRLRSPNVSKLSNSPQRPVSDFLACKKKVLMKQIEKLDRKQEF